MRILLAAHRNDAPGIAAVARGLSESLPLALGSDNELLVVSQEPATSALGSAQVRWHLKPAGFDGRYGRFLYEQTAIPVLARSMDVIHMGDCRPLLLSTRPNVVTIHDLFILDAPEWFPPAVRQFKIAMLKATLAKQPAAIICVSEYTRSRLLAHIPQAGKFNVHVVHPGIEPPIAPPPRTDEAPYFLTLSEINPRKNLLTLLRAFQLARRRGLELRWKLAGPPGFRSKSLISALKSVDGVEVLGLVSREEREALYRDARFMAFPSHAEGFGLPPLEAMIRGVPTICSKGTAMDETLGEAAFRVEAGDVRGWTEALLRLAREDSLRKTLVEAGIRQAQSFTMERMADAHMEVYRSAICRGPADGTPSRAPTRHVGAHG